VVVAHDSEGERLTSRASWRGHLRAILLLKAERALGLR
jgi:hypothetical protein